MVATVFAVISYNQNKLSKENKIFQDPIKNLNRLKRSSVRHQTKAK